MSGKSVWLARCVLHLKVWIPQPFLVGAKKTKLGLGIGVGADVITKIEVFHCTLHKIINRLDYSCLVMCLLL